MVGGGDKKELRVAKHCGLDGWREMGGKNRKLKFLDYEKENGTKKNRKLTQKEQNKMKIIMTTCAYCLIVTAAVI